MADNDFEDFITKVDDITKLIKEMNSSDQEIQKNALKAADNYLKPDCGKSLKFDKTIFNTKVSDENPEMNQFKSFIEEDAKKRSLDRKKRYQKAHKLKEKGTQHYKNMEYDKACNLYTEALNKAKDYAEVYGMRAQVFLMLENYEDALKDCNTCIELESWDKKVCVRKIKCLLFLKRDEEAVEFLNHCANKFPDYKDLFQAKFNELKNIFCG